jgi:hypothetical protein
VQAQVVAVPSELAIALTPLEKDVINGSRVLQYFAITAAWAGDKELLSEQG